MHEEINLNKILLIDIETVPQKEHLHQIPFHLQELWAEKTKYQRKDEFTPEQFYKRAAIWAEFGKIICISVGFFYNDKGKHHLRVGSYFGDDEVKLLKDFQQLLSTRKSDIILCAHNGKEFDFPFLCRRMLINGIQLPIQLQLSKKKPWEINHIDTMDLWKFGDHKNYTSLSLLATVLDIPTPKDEIDGSSVYEIYYQHRDLHRIANYCQKDVITVAQILLRFKGLDAISSECITLVSPCST